MWLENRERFKEEEQVKQTQSEKFDTFSCVREVKKPQPLSNLWIILSYYKLGQNGIFLREKELEEKLDTNWERFTTKLGIKYSMVR